MPSLPRNLRITFVDLGEGDTITNGRIASRGTDDAGSTRIWIIIASVAGILAIGACIALVAMSRSKRRLQRQLLREARRRDPCLGKKEFGRKRRMTQDTLECEAESQRDAIIRKSLASRSGHSVSSISQLPLDMMSEADRPDSRSTEEYRLRDDDDFERGYTRLRSGTGLSDKSWESGISTRSMSPFPEMPARTMSRSSSPSRLLHVAPGRSDLPPLLEQHPLFRKVSDDVDSDFERD